VVDARDDKHVGKLFQFDELFVTAITHGMRVKDDGCSSEPNSTASFAKQNRFCWILMSVVAGRRAARRNVLDARPDRPQENRDHGKRELAIIQIFRCRLVELRLGKTA
jgi:hypothetical protein